MKSRRVGRGGLSLIECILSACVAIAVAVGLGFVPTARGGDRDHDDHEAVRSAAASIVAQGFLLPAAAERLIAQAEANNVLNP